MILLAEGDCLRKLDRTSSLKRGNDMSIDTDIITVAIVTTANVLVMIEEIKIITAAGSACAVTKATMMNDGLGEEWRTADIITQDVLTPILLGRPRLTAVGDRRLRTAIGEADLHLHTIAALLLHQSATTRTIIKRATTALSTTAKASPQTAKSLAETPHRRTKTPKPMPKRRPPDWQKCNRLPTILTCSDPVAFKRSRSRSVCDSIKRRRQEREVPSTVEEVISCMG